METLDPEFRALLKDYDLAGLESHTGVVYALWEDFRFAYLNPAWFRFARDNGGEPRISREWGLDRSILDCVSGDVRAYYETHYNECLSTNKVWAHEYECSTADVYRNYHQNVYRLGQGRGLLIVNALVIERPHDPDKRQARSADEHQYLDKRGLICQCAFCRLVKNVQAGGRWDWVPEWVRACPANTSHTFCPMCFPHYFHRPAPPDLE